MRPRYTLHRVSSRHWDIFDNRHGYRKTWFPTKRSAQSWIDEHAETLPPGFIRQVYWLDVLEGGGERTFVTKELKNFQLIQGTTA